MATSGASRSPASPHAVELRQAVALALGGDWQAAHEIAQKYEEDDAACWLHGIVHRMEGDLANARYWYGVCRRTLREEVSTETELRELQAALG